MRIFRPLLLIIGLSFSGQEPQAQGFFSDDNGAIEFFETRIRPLFAERCWSCHGQKKQEGGLNLSSRVRSETGGDSGPALSPGNPQKSLLFRAVEYEGDFKMPPDGRLSEAEIADLSTWIQNGAVWPDRESSDVPDSAVRDQKTDAVLWSLQPVCNSPLPVVKTVAWPCSPVDYFVLAGLENQALTPALPAIKPTLLRRVTLDLTGLPPTPKEFDEFLNDQSAEAYAKVVDRLLASPHYGERWGRHWLDVVRYADARDLIQLPAESDFREAWRYRDWVVKAFNQDLPYDQFVRMQIAGDLMQPADPAQMDADALVATGMLAIADFVPGDVNKDQMIADCVNDQIDVVGRAIMGMTIACARCHDHKFDPVSTEDYYSLAGIFFSTRVIPGPVPGNTPLIRVPLLPAAEIKAIETQAERDRTRLAELSDRTQTSTDREYVAYLERQVVTEFARDLELAVDYLKLRNDINPPSLLDFSESHGANGKVLERWVAFLQQQPALSTFNPLQPKQSPSDGPLGNDSTAIQHLAEKLLKISELRREEEHNDPVATSLKEFQLLHFRADDLHIITDANGRIAQWPDRAAIADDAIPVQDSPGPQITTALIGGILRPVARFDGNAVLQAKRTVPTTGSLFAVIRADSGAAGTRVVGWEDASVGQHGLGLMPTADGGIHAILRRKGTSGDIVVTGSGTSDFQMISLTWGPGGVTCFLNGNTAGANTLIDSVSSDPTVTALRIGGPGSGAGQRFRGDMCELRVYSAALSEVARLRVERELKSRWLDGPAETLQSVASDPIVDLYNELLSPRSPYWIDAEMRLSLLPEEVQQRITAEKAELEVLKHKPVTEIPKAVVVQDGGPPGTKHAGFQDAHIYIRGNPAKPGAIVARGFPRTLGSQERPAIQGGSGRMELSRWLTHPSHPLTARVMVNRIWQHHFGEGLVRTSTNFGVRGELPSHPELLDYLATRFMESGWSVKTLHRLILLSSVYQQSSQELEPETLQRSAREIDPDNRLLSRMPRRRLDAEAIRDSLLAVSGLLDPAAGGPGFPEVDVPRRSLYLMSVRTGAKTSDFSSLFDGATGGGIIERRGQSIVAPQALFLMNHVWLDRVSAALAARVIRETPSNADEDKIHMLYKIALGREPTPMELDIGMQLLRDRSEELFWDRYCRLILCSNEFIYVD